MSGPAFSMIKCETELEQLRRFVKFVNLWCYRDCSASEEERLSVIKFHPTARSAAKAAGWLTDGEKTPAQEPCKAIPCCWPECICERAMPDGGELASVARCDQCGTDYTPGERQSFCPHERR